MVRQPHGYRFGDFEVFPEGAELRHSGEAVHLEPKVLKVLVFLIEHRERLVEKSEILDAVWEESFVTENALTKAIGRLRQALEDDAQDPRYIQTVHTLGYRFIAEVEESGVEEADGGSMRPNVGRAGRRLWLACAIVALAAVGAALVRDAGGLRTRLFGDVGPPSEIRSLAVLPLENLTGEPEQGYLVDAIHDALIGELAQMKPLRVISRHSTLRYRDSRKTVPEIAGELGVDAIVEGSVTQSGGRVRVSAQLIRGADDRHLWAASFDQGFGDLLILLSELSGAIGEEIQIAVTLERKAQKASLETLSPEGEEAYLRGRYFFSRGSVDGFLKAREYFTTATELEPQFAPAHAGLATAHFVLGLFGRVPPQIAAAETEKAALAALELAPDLAEARGALGMVRLYFDWDWPAAGHELKRALDLNPNDSAIRHGYGDYLLAMGRPEESLEQIELGRQCDPASPIAVAPVVGHLLFLRRYDEVIEQARVLLEADPRFPLVEGFLIAALWEKGEHDEALALLQARWSDRAPEIADALDRGVRESDPQGAALAVAEHVAVRAKTGRASRISAARYFVRGQDFDRALELLEQAVEAREPGVLHVMAYPAFDVLRPDPRFKSLLERIGFPAAASG